MRLAATMFSLGTDGEPARAVRITGDKGCNVWIGSVVLCGNAEAWRQLAAVALEAARIEDECAAVRK